MSMLIQEKITTGVSRFEELKTKIENKTAKVGIIGLGYVGLPTAVQKAWDGFDVTGFDVSTEKVTKINAGQNYIEDVDSILMTTLVDRQLLRATTDFITLSLMDIILICVPTPINKYKQPDLSFVSNAAISIAKYASKGSLIVLESTTYPGTTEEYIVPLLEAKGMTIGEDIFVAYSPERIDPGNKTFSVQNTPKLVGGITPACTELTCKFLGNIAVPVSNARIAEMAKAYENAFRYVNIGFVNEMAQLCEKLDIDIWEVVNAAGTKPYGFMPFYPGVGVGGHCIPVDPYYITHKAKEVGHTTRFIELAGEVNDSMTTHTVNKVSRMLNMNKKPLNGSRVLVLGVAYKPNIDDLRESPILSLLTELEETGAKVTVADPYFTSFKHNGKTWEVKECNELLVQNNDIVILTTSHSDFPYEMIAEHAELILDTKDAFNSNYHFKGIIEKL